tara:strand:- start:1178 stop:2242 length:1065 start_codon:yes stop_codon:yes gene_type:complete
MSNSEAQLTEIAEVICGTPVSCIRLQEGGGNSRVFEVITPTKSFALKEYPNQNIDEWSRVSREFGGLKFLVTSGVQNLPKPIGYTTNPDVAVYEWIDGERVACPAASDIDTALAFLSDLKSVGEYPGASDVPLATESCLTIASLNSQIERRINRLNEVLVSSPGLGNFLRSLDAFVVEQRGRLDEFVKSRKYPGDRELKKEYQTLSPSDFGFHNALRRPDGGITFLDFEYFGWDDPVRVISDFILHPGMELDNSAIEYFVAGACDLYCADPLLEVRLDAMFPMIGLRWVLILLNEFLPERLSFRVRAGNHDPHKLQMRQLEKAECLFHQGIHKRWEIIEYVLSSKVKPHGGSIG